MRRAVGVALLALWVILGVAARSEAASEEALKLRQSNGLVAYEPSEAFLSAMFVADEVDPHFIFGPVKAFLKTRSCPTTWLMEEGEKTRVASRKDAAGPFECTLYLEEDCPGKVVYYVFIDRSQADPAQWMAWRKQFHKNKAEPEYGGMKAELEQAAQKGFPVGAELRFVEVNGDLQLKKPEDFLREELKYQPAYDVKQGKALDR